jgi:hypothetical protein
VVDLRIPGKMSETTIKKRLARAKRQAIRHFEASGYRIVESDNKTFCFIASRRREARFIRVVVDKITDADLEMARGFEVPDTCAREIFCQKNDRFEIREIRE